MPPTLPVGFGFLCLVGFSSWLRWCSFRRTADPNPFTDAVTFRFGGPSAGPLEVKIRNALGQLVTRLPLRPAANSAAATWRPAPVLPSGVYLACVPYTSQTLRLLRQ